MPLITITQDYGSHGYFVAQQVAERLQLHLYDDETLRHAAVRLGEKTENLDGLKEKVPGFFDQLMHGKKDVYLDVLQGVVYQIASENNGVIVGHGSQVLLKDFGCALHVRIITPAEKRVRYFMEKRGLDEDQAWKLVTTKDEEASDFFRYAFKMDINDPLLYDIVINTEKISIDSVISHIMDQAGSHEIAECSIDALAIMKCRALERNIHAKLIQADVKMIGIQINVPEPGRARIHGVINDNIERMKITDVLATMPELKDVEMNLVEAPVHV